MDKRIISLVKKLVLILVGLLVFGMITIGGIELTCSSWFCISCHEMKELGDSWKFSKHGPYNANNPKMHDCMKCHSQPGIVGFLKAKISGLFSLVYHLSNNYHIEATQPVVCIREGCHQLEELDRVDLRSDRVVGMNHRKHIKVMEKVGTRSLCMPCHRRIAHGYDNYMPDMKKDCLATCHIDEDIKASRCSFCHQSHLEIRLKGKEASLLDLHGETSCVECHEGLCRATGNTCEQCHEGEGYGSLIIVPKKSSAARPRSQGRRP